MKLDWFCYFTAAAAGCGHLACLSVMLLSRPIPPLHSDLSSLSANLNFCTVIFMKKPVLKQVTAFSAHG